jgi:hypothetical protein
MTEGITMNIKEKIAYLDEIDDLIGDAIDNIAKKSKKPIKNEAMEQHKVGIIAESREVIIERLESIGGVFPHIYEEF